MRKLITDEELIDYVAGNASRSDILEIEEKAIINNETDMLLHATFANYESLNDYAEELLGEDNFDVTNTNIISLVQTPYQDVAAIAADCDIPSEEI